MIDTEIMQVEIAFGGNLRLGLESIEDPTYHIGIPKEFSKETEYHVL